MSKYKSFGPLTYDLGYLMNQLGVRTAAQRNGQTYHYTPKPEQPAKAPQFDPEPANYNHTSIDPDKYKHDQALRRMLAGLK